MIRIKGLMFFLLTALLLAAPLAHAGWLYEHEFFLEYDPSDTYVYAVSGTGMIEVARFDRKSLLIYVETLNGTSVTLKIEGGQKNSAGTIIWGPLYAATYEATGIWAIKLDHNFRWLRAGLIAADDAAGDNVTVLGTFSETIGALSRSR